MQASEIARAYYRVLLVTPDRNYFSADRIFISADVKKFSPNKTKTIIVVNNASPFCGKERLLLV